MKFRAILDDEYDIENRVREKYSAPWMKTLIFFVVIAVLLNILAIIYVNSGKVIYFWDDATYWDIARSIAAGKMSEGGFWRNVYNSVSELDYNYIAALPSAAVMRIFGESRLVYVLGLVNMYLVPSCAVIYHMAGKISKAPKIALILTLLVLPSMLFLTFIGFVDVGGLLICLAAYDLYYTRDGVSEKFWHYPLIGVLLVFAMLWRRYFAFFAVSFITAMIADCVLFRRKWYNAAAVIAAAGAVLALFFRDYVVYKLMADYGNMYAGYKFSFSTDLKLITRYFGLMYIVILAAGSVRCAVRKKETRVFFVWLQAVSCLIMFVSTQTHGQQHLLLYLPALITLTLFIIGGITTPSALACITAVAVLHFTFVYIPRPQPQNIQEIRHMSLIPTFSMHTKPRADAEEILALKTTLDGVVPEGERLGVLSSSFTLNEDILKNAAASLGKRDTRENYIVSLPQVDSRDTDLSPLWSVSYILAAYPAQTHLAQGSQTVVTEAVRSFENYADIATAYEELPEYETALGDITVKLYRRVRDVTAEDVNDFRARLYQ